MQRRRQENTRRRAEEDDDADPPEALQAVAGREQVAGAVEAGGQAVAPEPKAEEVMRLHRKC